MNHLFFSLIAVPQCTENTAKIYENSWNVKADTTCCMSCPAWSTLRIHFSVRLSIHVTSPSRIIPTKLYPFTHKLCIKIYSRYGHILQWPTETLKNGSSYNNWHGLTLFGCTIIHVITQFSSARESFKSQYTLWIYHQVLQDIAKSKWSAANTLSMDVIIIWVWSMH